MVPVGISLNSRLAAAGTSSNVLSGQTNGRTAEDGQGKDRFSTSSWTDWLPDHLLIAHSVVRSWTVWLHSI